MLLNDETIYVINCHQNKITISYSKIVIDYKYIVFY